MDNLRPCPFCGSAKVYITQSTISPTILGIECLDCPAEMDFSEWREEITTEKAVAFWNTRG